MSAALKGPAADYWLLWRMALSTRHPRASAIVLGLTGVATLVVALLVQLKNADPLLTASFALRIALGGMMMGWMLYFVPGAVKLNSPFTARLVPRLRRRLIELTALVWLVAIVSSALMAQGTKLSPALVFLGTGTWLAAYGLGQSGNRMGAWVQFAAWTCIVFNQHLPAGLVEQLKGGTGFAVAALLMLAFGALALQWMFLNGGERHYAAREAQILQAEKLTAAGQFKERRQHRIGASLYEWVLRRDSTARNSGRLLGHLLGARNHWVYRALAMGGILAGGVVAVGLLHAFGSLELQEMTANIGWAGAALLMLGALFDCERRNVRLKDTATEQALMRLVPPLPAGAPAFNRHLARTLLRVGLLEWAMLAATVLCLGLLSGASPADLGMQACLCCLTLPVVAANLRDHAHHAGLLGWRLLCGFVLSVCISFAVGAVAHTVFGLPVLAGAALASIVIAIALVANGFRRAETAPYAFPAGRLA